MSIYKYIAAVGIVVASLYVRVYRRLAAEIAFMRMLNGSFTIGGSSVKVYCSRVVLEYAISRLGSVGVTTFACCVTTNHSSAHQKDAFGLDRAFWTASVGMLIRMSSTSLLECISSYGYTYSLPTRSLIWDRQTKS